jgi:hypothetical protein
MTSHKHKRNSWKSFISIYFKILLYIITITKTCHYNVRVNTHNYREMDHSINKHLVKKTSWKITSPHFHSSWWLIPDNNSLYWSACRTHRFYFKLLEYTCVELILIITGKWIIQSTNIWWRKPQKIHKSWQTGNDSETRWFRWLCYLYGTSNPPKETSTGPLTSTPVNVNNMPMALE